MARKPKVKINSAGARAVLKSAGVQADLDARADRIAAAAGSGYEASTYPWRTRGRSSVITGNGAAMRDNSRNQTLLRAVNAGRRP